MKKLTFTFLFIIVALVVNAQKIISKAPAFAIGNFMDDYKITYSITDSLWIQNGYAKYHIIKWNSDQQYLVAKNDPNNKTDKNKYTRIDYMTFSGMEPFLWGFCLTAYDAETDEIAEKTASADRQNPKKGCNGYPFSRMKKVEPIPITN